jgi:hypothetical protein
MIKAGKDHGEQTLSVWPNREEGERFRRNARGERRGRI